MASPDSTPEPLTEHVEGVRRLARQLVARHDAAEDVAQEALLLAAQRRPDESWRLAAWLRGLVRNKARERARAERRRLARERRAPGVTAVPSAAELVARVEVHRRVLAAVLELPDPYRTVVWLRFFGNHGPRAIARLLGVPHETVRTQLKRALQRLRAQLDAGDRGGGTAWSVALLPLLGPSHGGTGSLIGEVMHVTMQSKVALTLTGSALLLLGGWGLGLFGFERLDEGPKMDAADASADGASTPHESPALESRSADPTRVPHLPDAPPSVDLAQADRQRDLHGVVVRRDGAPVAGAQLTAWLRRWESGDLLTLRDEKRRLVESRSATDGTFSLRLAPGTVVDLEVRTPGLARVVLARRNAGEFARVVLAAGVDLGVTVVAEDERPVGDCPVRLFRIARGLGREDVREEAVTDATGVAWFRGLPGGLTLALDAKRSDLGASGWVEVSLPEEGTLTKRLVLPPGRVVRGRVVDAESRQPVAGAVVGANWTASHPVPTNADGEYVYRGWTGKGTSVLTATAPGYARLWRKVGDADRVDFELRRGARLVGRVLAADGTPVADASVSGRALPQDEDDGAVGGFPSTVTAADGTFVLDGAAPIHDMLLAVQADGWGTHSETVGAARLAEATVELGDIRLGPERWLRGVVVDAEGAPAPRVEVILHALRPGASMADRWARNSTLYGIGGERFSDDLGRFTFRGLVAGDYRVVARPQGQGEILVAASVPSEGAAPEVRIVVPDTRSLEVEVVTSEGQPVQGLSVHCQGKTSNHHPGATTDARGRASLRVTGDVRYVGLGFPSGTYERYGGAGALPHRLRAGDRTLRFVLEECEPTLGRVLDGEGAPVPGAVVEARMPDGRVPSRSTTDSTGAFRCGVPRGRTVTLAVTGHGQRALPGGAMQGMDLALEGLLHAVTSGEKNLVLTVRPRANDRTLAVRVLAPDGSPAAGVDVEAHVAPLRQIRATTDGAGLARLAGLPDRPVDVRVNPGGLAASSGAIPLASERRSGVAPSDEILTITLRPSTLVQGRVVDARGVSLADIELTVFGPGQHPRTETSGPGGRVGLFVHPSEGFPLDVEATYTTPSGLLLRGAVRVASPDVDAFTLVLRRE